MAGLDYAIYDVFTDRALAGNPLAVVFAADTPADGAMQAVAREFNLSETVFVLPAEKSAHAARLRIFTPAYEMPFAGHPTVGAAIALAERPGFAGGEAALLVLEEKIGPVRCVVSKQGDMRFAEFDVPQLPQPIPHSATGEGAAAALGLDPQHVGFENHTLSAWSAGVPYLCVPVRGLDAAAKARLDTAAWLELAPRKSEFAVASAYVYCRDTVGHDNGFHARMFVPGNPGYEDPATGSAAAAFAGAIAHFDRPSDGLTSLWIEQGIEMGRPSRIRLELDVEAGGPSGARIGGNAVKVAEGKLFV